MRFSTKPKKVVGTLMVVGAVATASCGQEPRGVEGLGEPMEAQVTVYNRTHDLVPMTYQGLRGNLAIDCDLVTQRSADFLRNEHLSSSVRQRLYSGQESGLIGANSVSGSQGCRLNVVRTDDGRVDDVVVAWPRDLEEKSFYLEVDAPADIPAGENTLMLRADYSQTPLAERRSWQNRPCDGDLTECSEEEQNAAIVPPSGAVYSWELIGDRPTMSGWSGTSIEGTELSDALDEGSCSTGITGPGLRWTYPPSGGGEWQVLAVNPAEEEGCYAVALRGAAEDRTWQICGSERLASRLAPVSDLNPLYVQFFVDIATPNSDGEVAYANISIDLRRENRDGEVLEVETIDLVRGYSIPSHLALDYTTRLSEECAFGRENPTCLQISAPVTLELRTATGTLDVIAGETVALGSETTRRVELVRGLHRAVVDQSCTEDLTGLPGVDQVGAYMELVYYSGVTTLGG